MRQNCEEGRHFDMPPSHSRLRHSSLWLFRLNDQPALQAWEKLVLLLIIKAFIYSIDRGNCFNFSATHRFSSSPFFFSFPRDYTFILLGPVHMDLGDPK